MPKLPKSHFNGNLKIGNLEINCAVLDDGTRLVANRSFATFIGYKGTGKYWKEKKEGKLLLPEFISLPKLQPYISDELREKLLNPIEYISRTGSKLVGADASIIPDVCDVWIKAQNEGILNETQVKVALNAQKLLSAFARIGIIALVDEATGYQEIREKAELQKILEAYVSNDLLPWSLKFPLEFYKEIYRLKGWDFNPKGRKKWVIGQYTNKYVYDKLPNGVLEEIKRKTPKSKVGNYLARFHQWMTTDIGNPHLKTQIAIVYRLLRMSRNWNDFEKNFAQAFPEENKPQQPELGL